MCACLLSCMYCVCMCVYIRMHAVAICRYLCTGVFALGFGGLGRGTRVTLVGHCSLACPMLAAYLARCRVCSGVSAASGQAAEFCPSARPDGWQRALFIWLCPVWCAPIGVGSLRGGGGSDHFGLDGPAVCMSEAKTPGPHVCMSS